MSADRSDQTTTRMTRSTGTVAVLSLVVAVVLGDSASSRSRCRSILRELDAEVTEVAWVLMALQPRARARGGAGGRDVCVRGDAATATAAGLSAFATAIDRCAWRRRSAC